eukprot:TRINITY_DN66876_c0_g1_i1.p1 TRINITY_DN66876_c0_g1~~TRINITY_DN66876_c0_g1_i1.p1  ORF type:complete len:425 (+),score=155.48 TRINITY_DN66876_c0_g1_i1:71-1276(+)
MRAISVVVLGLLAATAQAQTVQGEHPFTCLAQSAHHDVLVAGDTTGTVHMWNSATLKPTSSFKAFKSNVTSLVFQGPWLWVASHEGAAMYDISGTPTPIEQYDVKVNAMALSPDGTEVAFATTTGVKVNTTASNDLTDIDALEATAIVYANEHIIAGGPSGVNIFRTTKPYHVQQVTGASVYDVAVSPDGMTLLVGSHEHTHIAAVNVFDLDHGTATQVKGLGAETSAYAIAFSPDGSTAATAIEDGKLLVWNMTDYTLLYAIDGPAGQTTGVVFISDTVVVASGPSSLLVSDLKSAAPVLSTTAPNTPSPTDAPREGDSDDSGFPVMLILAIAGGVLLGVAGLAFFCLRSGKKSNYNVDEENNQQVAEAMRERLNDGDIATEHDEQPLGSDGEEDPVVAE